MKGCECNANQQNSREKNLLDQVLFCKCNKNFVLKSISPSTNELFNKM